MAESNHKSIYEYDNYRVFLEDQFKILKEQNPKFSHRFFAKQSGVKSSSFLLSVMKGRANFSAKTAESVAKALNLSKDETFYFKNLVLLNQATTIEERQLYAQQVLKSVSYRRARPLAEPTYRYFTHWYYVAIKELVGFPDFKEDPKWISKRLHDEISESDAKRALSELMKLGLLIRGQNKKLIQSQDTIVIPDEVTTAFAVQYHEELISLGGRAIRKYPREFREISATTFKVSKKNLGKVKETLQRFRKEIVEMLVQEAEPDGLYQLNLQLFPLAPFLKDSKALETES